MTKREKLKKILHRRKKDQQTINKFKRNISSTPLVRGCLKTIKLPKYKLTVIGKKLEIAWITQPPTPNPEPRCLSIQTAS